MAKKANKELSVEEKLQALYNLQSVDSEIDKIEILLEVHTNADISTNTFDDVGVLYSLTASHKNGKTFALSTGKLSKETVTFTDQSSGPPTSWSWSFSPTTVSFVGGTTATSQNPQVVFNNTGAYTVSLTATNASCPNINDGNIQVFAHGGGNPYSYTLNSSTTQTSSLFPNLGIGNYTISITDTNGCLITDTITIQSSTMLSGSLYSTNDTCNQGNGSISAIISSGAAPYQYIWNTTPTNTLFKYNLTYCIKN